MGLPNLKWSGLAGNWLDDGAGDGPLSSKRLNCTCPGGGTQGDSRERKWKCQAPVTTRDRGSLSCRAGSLIKVQRRGVITDSFHSESECTTHPGGRDGAGRAENEALAVVDGVQTP